MAPGDTVGDLNQVLHLDPTAPVLDFGADRYTYGELSGAIDSTRATLRDHAVRAGSPVATVLPNTPAGLVALLSVLLERACIVTISPRRIEADLAAAPATVATVGPSALLSGATAASALDVDVVPAATGAPSSQDGVAVLMATSGTTGQPKRIPITLVTIDGVVNGVRSLARTANPSTPVPENRNNRRRVEPSPPALRDDTTLVCFPYTNLSGLLPQLIALVSGRRTALLERFDPEQVAALAAAHQMTSLALNPTAMQMLMDADINPGLLASVRYVRSGSAPLRPDLAGAFEDRFGVGVLQSYGQTEVGGEVVGWSSADHRAFGADKRGSVGRPHPGIELRVTTGDQEPADRLPAGQVGQLWLRGARNVEGWHRTGDLARVDEDGFVWIEGRADGLIICGGFNVVPAALERAIERHPDVAESAVVARPDERLGEVPVAIVVRRPGSTVGADVLVTHCRAHLEPYQVPRAVVFADELPRTEIGKIHLPSLRDLAGAAGDNR